MNYKNERKRIKNMEVKEQKELYKLFGQVSSSLDKVNDLIRLNNLIKPEEHMSIEWFQGELSALEISLHKINCKGESAINCHVLEWHEED